MVYLSPKRLTKASLIVTTLISINLTFANDTSDIPPPPDDHDHLETTGSGGGIGGLGGHDSGGGGIISDGGSNSGSQGGSGSSGNSSGSNGSNQQQSEQNRRQCQATAESKRQNCISSASVGYANDLLTYCSGFNDTNIELGGTFGSVSVSNNEYQRCMTNQAAIRDAQFSVCNANHAREIAQKCP